MASKMMIRKNLKSAMGFYYTYAAFRFEGYFCCAEKEFPATHRV